MQNPGLPHDDTLLAPLLEAADEAASRIMADHGKIHVIGRKGDGSPVTSTDAAAENIVVGELRKLPYKIVAEEAASAGDIPDILPQDAFWLVDALDGTREFIKGGHDFTVNAALIRNGQPVLGVIKAPVMNITWYAQAGKGAFKIENGVTTRIAMRSVPKEGAHLLGGKRSGEPVVLGPFIGAQAIAGRVQRSSSLKFCLVAEGQADLYPRLGETYEWDTAAGDVIVREAGGAVLDLATREPIRYGKAAVKFVNGGFIAGSKIILGL